MPKVLILFAHPMLEKSNMQMRMVNAVKDLKKVFVHDLYEAYPDFNIDVAYEQELLLAHDVIVMQHPLYWYSVPAMLKQWIDLVLEHGWAYCKEGNALAWKQMFQAISAGGPQVAYTEDGFNQHTMHQFLAPFRQTAVLCKMQYLPPFVAHATHRTTSEEKDKLAQQYQQLMLSIVQQTSADALPPYIQYLNDIIPSTPGN